MPDTAIVKYHVKLKFEVDGVVEKADLVGAIFGQTEGLFGPKMNLNELQKTWKVGRIEINLDSKNGKTHGEVIIPMSTDIQTASLIAAAVENVDKVGPCTAHFQLAEVEDVRAARRKAIVDRAKLIMKDWATKTESSTEEELKDVADSAKAAKIISYGREELPAGPGIYASDNIIIVEGRADVLNLLRAGIENSVAVEGTNVPESIARLSRDRKAVAFLDGDRGGDLILRELMQVARIEKVYRAPPGREVEELTPVEILDILKREPAPMQRHERRDDRRYEERRRDERRYEEPRHEERELPPVQLPDDLAAKTKEVFAAINGTLEGVVLDEGMNEKARVTVSELVKSLQSIEGARYVIFDGIITQRLVDASEKAGVKFIVGHRAGDLSRKPEVAIGTFRDAGLE
ncbi:MAG: DNA primase [Thaumarchaeota archaeon]|nr:DNA primase [Nitrososphaerota archaeon]